MSLAGVLAALGLLLVANGAPVLAHRLLGTRLARPLDGGRRLADGQPLLGPSKTWRGLAAALAASTLAAPAVGLSPAEGTLFGLCAMGGDLLSSFAKRRLRIPPSDSAPGLDQGPEALLPVLALRGPLALGGSGVLITVLAFLVLEVLLSRLLFRLHVRDRPQ